MPRSRSPRAARPGRQERDAAVVADIIAGVGLNEIARRHQIAKKTVLALKRGTVPEMAAAVRTIIAPPRKPVAVSETAAVSVSHPPETAAETSQHSVNRDDAVNLARLIVGHLRESFGAQAAITARAQDPEWLAKFGPIELAHLYTALATQAQGLLGLLEPAE